MRRISVVIVVFLTLVMTGGAQAACGKVTIADMNWPSATLMAHVDAMILKHGYGCDAELITGDTMPTGTSMIEKGEPDIAPELWTNSFAEALQKGIDEKRLRIAGKSLSDGGEEGFWVPKYMVDEMPELATIAGVKKHAKLFKHPEDPSKSGFVGCPAGWNCQISSGQLFSGCNSRTQDLSWSTQAPPRASTVRSQRHTSASSPGSAITGHRPPSSANTRWLKSISAAASMRSHFKDCITQTDCEAPKPTMYPPSPVHTVTVEDFAKRAPDAFAYLSKRAFTNSQMNKLLVWMAANQADGETAAAYFLKNHTAKWKTWVSADVARKVYAAL